MNLWSALVVALDALRVNKGRSALTSLGIVIGIAAVIALVSAGSGARRKLDDRLDTVGKNLILIRAGARNQQGMVADYVPLTMADADAIRQSAGSYVTGVAPTQMTNRIASTPYGRWSTSIVGSTTDIQRVRNWTVSQGRFYTDADNKAMSAVCLIGQTVRHKLFPHQPNPVGESLRIDHLELRVIGVLGSKGRSPTGADQDDQIFVPIITMQRRMLGSDKFGLIVTAAKAESSIEAAKEAITKALRKQHHLREDQPTDFDVSSVREMAELAEILTSTMQGLVAVIASISLVVGGIGIMNIMLVSVTERTREIGLRMAIGATPADVLTQFLIEAILLALVGGFLGVALGLSVSMVLAWFVEWPFVVQPAVILIGFGVAGGVGVFFGFYPARKASQLDPIEALRYE
jgi:putative ABC transport system permease protein